MQTCKNCGEYLDVESKFCPHCGSKQDNTPINNNQFSNYNQQTQPYQNNNYDQQYQNNNYNQQYQNNNYNKPYQNYPPPNYPPPPYYPPPYYPPPYYPPYPPPRYNYQEEENESSFGWGVLGAIMPIVGLILFIAWINSRPEDAKAAINGVFIRVILTILFIIFIF